MFMLSGSSLVRRLAVVGLPVAMAAFLAAPAVAGGDSREARPGMAALSGGVLNALAFHQGRIVPDRADAAARDGRGLPMVLPNVRASLLGDLPVNETPIAASPMDPLMLMTAGNDYNCDTIQGFYNSSFGGYHWHHHQHCHEALPGKLGFGDPNVAFDDRGVAYAAGINAEADLTGGVIAFMKSPDGHEFGPTFAGPTAFYPDGLPDKPWTEADHGPAGPYAGCLYTSITQFDTSFNRIRITVDHSCDGGATWSGPVPVSPEQVFPDVVQFSDLAVGADGTVYVTWMDCRATGPAGDCGDTNASIYFSRSVDGGDTWSSPALIHTVHLAPDSCQCAFYGNVPATRERTSEIPVIDVDDATGKLYVADYHYTGEHMQLRVTGSVDDGATWGTPVVVNGNSTRDQFLYWLSVSETGIVGVTYLHRSRGSYRNYAALSTDRGATWKFNRAISDIPSRFSEDGFGGSFMGDYSGNVWTGDILHASWVDTRRGVGQDYTGGVSL
jgi:hypothetical protein